MEQNELIIKITNSLMRICFQALYRQISHSNLLNPRFNYPNRITNTVIDQNSNHIANKIWIDFYNMQMLKSPRSSYVRAPRQIAPPGDARSRLTSRANKAMEPFAASCIKVETKVRRSCVIKPLRAKTRRPSSRQNNTYFAFMKCRR